MSEHSVRLLRSLPTLSPRMTPKEHTIPALQGSRRATLIALILGALVVASLACLSAGPSSDELKAARDKACDLDPYCLRP